MAVGDADVDEVRLFVEADMEEPVELYVAGGRAVVLSVRSPAKDTANEDAAGVLPLWPGRGVLCVADGMGGHAAGDRASAEAMHALRHSLAEMAAEEGSLRNGILDGFERANRRILEAGLGSATTLAVAEIGEDGVRPYHAGDSVVLLVGQRGRIKHQSTPHSPVGQAVEAGLLDEDDALHHDERHLVTNAVGSDDMHIEVGPTLSVAPRDTLLLASDGLFDNLTIAEIVSAIRCGPLAARIRDLAAVARRRMTEPSARRPSKPDDLTLVAWRPARR